MKESTKKDIKDFSVLSLLVVGMALLFIGIAYYFKYIKR